jgi:stage II sporulation protein D
LKLRLNGTTGRRTAAFNLGLVLLALSGACSFSGGMPPAGPGPGGAPAPTPVPPNGGTDEIGADIKAIREEPVLRVAVKTNAGAATVTSATRFSVTGADEPEARELSFPAGATVSITPLPEGIGIAEPTGKVSLVRQGPVTFAGPDGSPVSVDGVAYRGGLEVRLNPRKSLTVVNQVPLEAYLRGVVPNEIGHKDPKLLEAVKAQAIAARTYALAFSNRYPEEGYDLLNTVEDQVYNGVKSEALATDQAIAATRGIISTWQDEPIIMNYSSTCGGRTADRDEVWPKPPLPYLVGVSDHGGDGAFCNTSKYFNWQETWTGSDFKKIVAQNFLREFRVAFDPEAVLKDVVITDRGASGRVKTLEFRTSRGNYRATGDRIRWVTQRPAGAGPLRSILFDVAVKKSKGRVTQVTFTGHGWGHGVGMCQVGAMERSRQGQKYDRILRHYYQGIDLTTLY